MSASAAEKIVRLCATAVTRPGECLDRIANYLAARGEISQKADCYTPHTWASGIAELEKALRSPIASAMLEAKANVEAGVTARLAEISGNAPFTNLHSADFGMAQLCYAVCRALRPAVAMETGVAYGVTSAFILQALAANGNGGRLFSIDLPPLAANGDKYVGAAIDSRLRGEWALNIGPSRRVMPALLERVGKVQFFIHDSLHTRKNILYELDAVTPYLDRPAVVIVDDAEGNTAFSEWLAITKPDLGITVREAHKDYALLGIAVFLK